jgi:hypothetical protein
MQIEEILSKLELIEVQARCTLALAKEIREALARQMHEARFDPEATQEFPTETLGRKAA